jgi:hypothetical protein
MKMHGLNAVTSEIDNRICLVLHLFSGACVSAHETSDAPNACDAFHRGFASAVGMSSFMFNTVLTSDIHHFQIDDLRYLVQTFISSQEEAFGMQRHQLLS